MAESDQTGEGTPNTAADEQIGRLLNEYLERREQGERVSKDVLQAEHPELAEELAQHLILLQALAPSSDAIQELLAKRVLSPPGSPEFVAELGHYGIKGVIGRGGMGIVLRAIEAPLNRLVALKILRPELAADHRALVRFEHEAKAAAALRHPNIVTVYACGAQNGTHYLAMEAIDGPSLADRLTQEPALSTQEIRRLFRELLLGLSAAHRAGLVHRDIKPSNILLDGQDRQVKIADFGLARIAASNTRITLPQAAIGTPEYMSPEQARGEENIDHRTDLYSAGVVLFEILTGRVPFKAETASAVIHAILHSEPPDPQILRKNVDPQLSGIALWLMAKHRKDRLASAAEALTVLVEHRYVPLWKRSRRSFRRVAWAMVLVAAAAIAVAGARWLLPSPLTTTKPVTIRDVKLGCPPDQSPPCKKIVASYRDDPADKVFLDLGADEPFRGWDSNAHAVILVTDRGEQSVLAAIDGPKDYRGLVAFNAQRQRLWNLDLTDSRRWPDCNNRDSWLCIDVKPFDSLGRQVLVTTRDRSEYPTRISVVELSDRQPVASFYHLGQLNCSLVVPNFFGPDRPAIVAWGNNNKLDGFAVWEEGDPAPRAHYDYVAVVVILDPSSMAGVGPPRTLRFPDLGEARPFAYAYINLAGLRLNAYRPPGETEYRSVGYEQTAQIRRVSLTAEAFSGDSTQPVFNVYTEYVALKDEPEMGGVMLQVDRGLNILGVVPVTYEKVRTTREFWEPYWHVLIHDYEYVE